MQARSMQKPPHPGGGGKSHIKVTGMLVGKFKLTPHGDQCGCGSSLN